MQSKLKDISYKKIFTLIILAAFLINMGQVSYAFSIPFVKNKKSKQEQVQTKNETPAVQISTEKSEFVEYSLEDCIEIAIQNDPNIKIYTTQKDIAGSKLGIAKSAYGLLKSSLA